MHTAAKIRTREGLIIVIMANFLVFRDLPDPSCTTWWAVQLNCYCRTGGLLYIGGPNADKPFYQETKGDSDFYRVDFCLLSS